MPSDFQPVSESSGSPPAQSGPPANPVVDAGAGHESSGVSPRVKNGIAVVITCVWAIGIVADALLKDFALSGFVYATFLGLASSIFGSSFVKGFK